MPTTWRAGKWEVHLGSFTHSLSLRPIDQFSAVTKFYDERSTDAQEEIVVTLKQFGETYLILAPTIEYFFKEHKVNPNTAKSTYLEKVRVRVVEEPPAPLAPVKEEVVPIVEEAPAKPVYPFLSSRSQSFVESGLDPEQEEISFEIPDSEFFRGLVFERKCILAQNSNIQVGMLRERLGSRLRFTLYYGNLGRLELSELQISVMNPDFSALTFSAEEAPRSLKPTEQITQIVTVDCKKEFLGVPQFAISYVTANGTEVALHQHMPITIFSFTSPYPVTPADFLAAWKLINGSLLCSFTSPKVLTEIRRT